MLLPNSHINELEPCAHGGVDYTELSELGIDPDTVIDFSVSCNPFGPPSGIREALLKASVDWYPDTEATQFKQALVNKLHTHPENLIIGCGSTEIIRFVALAYLGPNDLVLIPQPTYGEYREACQLVGARVLYQQTIKDMSFQLDIADTAKLVQQHKPKAIFLCNPNNPTGQYLLKEEIEYIMSINESGLLVLDEAYIAFTTNAWSSADLINQGNVVIARSMTKDYALAGLRLGYALSTEPIISTLKRVRPPWNVSTTAQAAGIAALNASGYMEDCTAKVRECKDYLVRELAALGLPTVPSHTNFFLVEVGQATEFRNSLLKYGILVRDCTSFGLPEYVRLAPRTLPECQKLIAAVKEIGVHSLAR